MKLINQWLFVLLLLFSISGAAQKKGTTKTITPKQSSKQTTITKHDTSADEEKVRRIVSFLVFMLNTLGSSHTPVRDKEVLITQSYSKIFRDSKVQVEDDLDEERKVITNKDIVAYLKDVNFFFHDVQFEYTIEEIRASSLPNGNNFYKVTATRNLKGTTTEGKKVNSATPRYIEINYNPKDQDLKIVSIYTKEFDETRALTHWWTELSFEWQSIFKEKLNLKDSVPISDIKRVTSIDKLDISNNPYIQNLDPLAKLPNLQYLILSNTQISDLTPIRNLTDLLSLDISNTSIKSLSPIKYSTRLKELNLSNTQITDISVIEKFPQLEIIDIQDTPLNDFAILANLTEAKKLNLKGSNITDLSSLENLSNLEELNVSQTRIQDVSPLKRLENLKVLHLDSTGIRSISPLSTVEKLSVLHINHTPVSDLAPLNKLQHLEKVYCDQTLVKREEANAFMIAHPSVIVILGSSDLKVWWESLSADWKAVFGKAAGINRKPEKEDLTKLSLIDSINLSEYPNIDRLEPLQKFQNLEVLIAGKTAITDITSLSGLKKIKYLDLSETDVQDITIIQQLKQLEILKINKAKIKSIDFINLPSLKKLYVDETYVQDAVATAFLEKNSSCLLVYKTSRLSAWWNNLPESWKEVFRTVVGTNPSPERLHSLVEQEALHVKETQVSSLQPLSEFVRLNELHMSGTALTSITPIRYIHALKSLHATNSPIQQIDSLDQLSHLKDLDISNTPVSDIYALWRLKKLKKLNCAGTQLKRLDGLQKLENLHYLDCSNTNVNKLDILDYLPLKTLKCYNTKISNRVIENFKASHPDCNVMYYR